MPKRSARLLTALFLSLPLGLGLACNSSSSGTDPVSTTSSVGVLPGEHVFIDVLKSNHQVALVNGQRFRTGFELELTATTSDPQQFGDIVTISWSFSSTPTASNSSFTNPTSLITTFVPDTPGTYEITVDLTTYNQISIISLTSTQSRRIVVHNNEAPTVSYQLDAGADVVDPYYVGLGTMLTVTGNSTDANDDPITHSLTVTNSTSGSAVAVIDESDGEDHVFTFTTDAAADYAAIFVAYDGFESSTVEFVVQSQANLPPVAIISHNSAVDSTYTLNLYDEITLSAASSYDPDNTGELGYQWLLIESPADSKYASNTVNTANDIFDSTMAASQKSTITFNPDKYTDKTTKYIIRLNVDDGRVVSSVDITIDIATYQPVIILPTHHNYFVGDEHIGEMEIDYSVTDGTETLVWRVDKTPVGSNVTAVAVVGGWTYKITPDLPGLYTVSVVATNSNDLSSERATTNICVYENKGLFISFNDDQDQGNLLWLPTKEDTPIALSTPGSGIDPLQVPRGTALHGEGLFIADSNGQQVVGIDAIFDTSWHSTGDATAPGAANAADPHTYNSPASLAYGVDGRLYIIDSGMDRIAKIDPLNDTVWTTYGSSGAGIGQFNQPSAITMDSNNQLYIADTGNGRIVRVSSLLDPITPDWMEFATIGTSGDPITLTTPTDLALDRNNRLYIADSGNARIIAMPNLEQNQGIEDVDTDQVAMIQVARGAGKILTALGVDDENLYCSVYDSTANESSIYAVSLGDQILQAIDQSLDSTTPFQVLPNVRVTGITASSTMPPRYEGVQNNSPANALPGSPGTSDRAVRWDASKTPQLWYKITATTLTEISMPFSADAAIRAQLYAADGETLLREVKADSRSDINKTKTLSYFTELPDGTTYYIRFSTDTFNNITLNFHYQLTEDTTSTLLTSTDYTAPHILNQDLATQQLIALYQLPNSGSSADADRYFVQFTVPANQVFDLTVSESTPFHYLFAYFDHAENFPFAANDDKKRIDLHTLYTTSTGSGSGSTTLTDDTDKTYLLELQPIPKTTNDPSTYALRFELTIATHNPE